jgi:hypothetical protein
MSQAQPIIPAPIRPAWQQFLIRLTALDLRSWERSRSRGRRWYTRRLWVGGVCASLLLIPAQAYVVWRDALSWRSLVAPSSIGWLAGIAAGLALVLRLSAPAGWWLCEEKYRDELAKLGRRPAPPAA